MDHGFDALFAAFLQDHPEALAGVQMVDTEGQADPYMDMPTSRTFLMWAVALGLVEVDRALSILDALERHFAALPEDPTP
jgi:hypothetical protein